MHRTRIWSLVLVLLGAGALPAAAHVNLQWPAGGEQLAVGEMVTIRWTPVVDHGTQNWDLSYSTTGLEPWTVIAEDLPAGDTQPGAIHTFLWLVPDDPSDTVRVRVIQDNPSTDYEAVSGEDLSIVPALFADGFETGGTTPWSPGP